MKETIKTIKVPVLVGKCPCGAPIESDMRDPQKRAAWDRGEQFGIQCPSCGVQHHAQQSRVAQLSDVNPNEIMARKKMLASKMRST